MKFDFKTFGVIGDTNTTKLSLTAKRREIGAQSIKDKAYYQMKCVF